MKRLRRMTVSTLIAFAFVAFLSSGCGKSNQSEKQSTPATAAGPASTQKTSAAPASPTPALTGACALVLKSDVEAELGEAVKDPERIEMMGVHNCKYVAVNPSPYKSVSVFFQEVSSREKWQENVEEGARMVPSKVAPVPGIGDAALFWNDALNAGHLDVLKDSIAVSVQVSLGRLGSRDDSLKLKIARALAEKALSHV